MNDATKHQGVSLPLRLWRRFSPWLLLVGACTKPGGQLSQGKGQAIDTTATQVHRAATFATDEGSAWQWQPCVGSLLSSSRSSRILLALGTDRRVLRTSTAIEGPKLPGEKLFEVVWADPSEASRRDLESPAQKLGILPQESSTRASGAPLLLVSWGAHAKVRRWIAAMEEFESDPVRNTIEQPFREVWRSAFLPTDERDALASASKRELLYSSRRRIGSSADAAWQTDEVIIDEDGHVQVRRFYRNTAGNEHEVVVECLEMQVSAAGLARGKELWLIARRLAHTETAPALAGCDAPDTAVLTSVVSLPGEGQLRDVPHASCLGSTDGFGRLMRGIDGVWESLPTKP